MLTPDEIASRQFLVSLRGYDRDEVETFLRQVAGDYARLQEQVRELEGELAAVRDEDDETGEAEELDRASAFQSLGEETTRILVAAEESAAEIRTNAEQRANELIENASREARDEVQDARQQATRIVAEAEKQRDDIRRQAEEIETARSRLLEELREAVTAVQDAIHPLQETPQATGQATTEAAEVTTEATEVTAGTADEGAAAADAPASAMAEEAAEQAVAADREHVAPEVAAVDEAADEAMDEAVASAVSAPPEVEPDAGVGDELEPDETTAVDGDDEGAPAVSVVVEAGEADEAEEADETEEADDAEDAEEAREGAPDEGETAAPAAEPATEAPTDTEPMGLRQQTLATVRPGMLRRVKRALQDVQNETLTAVREAGGAPDLADVVPGRADLRSVDSIGDMFLTAAFRGGVGDAGVLAGDELDVDLGDKDRVAAVRDDLRETLTDEALSALRATLRAGIDAAEPEPLLSERIGEVFRDLKGPVVEAAVDRALMRAYSRGLLAGWKELGVEEVVWVLAEEARCPEGRCRTNEAESPVARGEAFPSGQAVPPAHDGCTCALVPAR